MRRIDGRGAHFGARLLQQVDCAGGMALHVVAVSVLRVAHSDDRFLGRIVGGRNVRGDVPDHQPTPRPSRPQESMRQSP
jgi:hypothetical protein